MGAFTARCAAISHPGPNYTFALGTILVRHYDDFEIPSAARVISKWDGHLKLQSSSIERQRQRAISSARFEKSYFLRMGLRAHVIERFDD